MSATAANIATYGPVAVDAANQAGIDPQLFLSLIMSESNFNPTAISSTPASNGAHALGISQLMPDTAAQSGVDPFNPFDSLYAAAKIAAGNIAKYGPLAGIAAYKGSPTNSTALSQAQNVINGTDNNGNSFLSMFSGILNPGESNITRQLKSPIGVPGGPTTINPTQPGGDSQGFFPKVTDTITNYVKASALGFSLGFVGLLIISISVIAMVMRSTHGRQIVQAGTKLIAK